MAATALTERYAANLHGALSCYDRIIVTGTLPGACYPGGMTSFLYAHGIRIFDYPKFAEPLRERIRERAQAVGAANGVSIEHVNKAHIRKEDLVARVLADRGDAPAYSGCSNGAACSMRKSSTTSKPGATAAALASMPRCASRRGTRRAANACCAIAPGPSSPVSA